MGQESLKERILGKKKDRIGEMRDFGEGRGGSFWK